MICAIRNQLLDKTRSDPKAIDELRSHIAGCPDCLDFIRSFPADGPPAPRLTPEGPDLTPRVPDLQQVTPSIQAQVDVRPKPIPKKLIGQMTIE